MSTPHSPASAWLLRHRWNFRAAPPEDDLARYLEAVIACAHGDGALTEAEREWVVGYGAALGLSEPALARLRALTFAAPLAPEALRAAAGRFSAKALLYDAIVACDSDHAYTAAEARTIRASAATLGVSEAAVRELEEVHEQEKALRARRLELVFSDEASGAGDALIAPR